MAPVAPSVCGSCAAAVQGPGQRAAGHAAAVEGQGRGAPRSLVISTVVVNVRPQLAVGHRVAWVVSAGSWGITVGDRRVGTCSRGH